MNYAGIITSDMANGIGVRLSVFVSGCDGKCGDACFSKELWDYDYGQPFTDDVITKIIKELGDPKYDGLSILGGEPLDPKNVNRVHKLIINVKSFSNKSIWLYTGYTYEQIEAMLASDVDDMIELNNKKYLYDIITLVDVIVDGPFILEKKNSSLAFRGSSNQRIIDAKKTKKAGTVILYQE